MKKFNSKKILILLSFSFFFVSVSCETTTQNTKKNIEMTQKTKKNIISDSKFELIPTFNKKKVNLLIQEYGEFDFTKNIGDLSLQRLDKGFCRVFVKSIISTGIINDILIFHLNKKKFYPQFKLQNCAG